MSEYSDQSNSQSNAGKPRNHIGPKAPDGWHDYSKIGRVMSGINFISFKTPLKSGILDNMEPDLRWSLQDLLDAVPNLGLVIDLTFTNKYYDPAIYKLKNIQYQKLTTAGHVIPSPRVSDQFCQIVYNFNSNRRNEGRVIGIHCTHGVNRTGFMVCQYLIRALRWRPFDAVNGFETARGHKIHRENYVNFLMNLDKI